MKTPLPYYQNGQTQVEAFRIIAIDSQDMGTVLHGENHIAHPIRSSHFDNQDLQVGHYYVRYGDGKEFILHAGAFEASYVAVP